MSDKTKMGEERLRTKLARAQGLAVQAIDAMAPLVGDGLYEPDTLGAVLTPQERSVAEGVYAYARRLNTALSARLDASRGRS